MDLVTVTNVSDDDYHGYDHGLEPPQAGLPGEAVAIPAGETVEVSAAKAAQLAEDHPEWFDVDGATKPHRRRKAQAKVADNADDDGE
jgi:hypothetical protein